jgi:excinuclease ABC subunit C
MSLEELSGHDVKIIVPKQSEKRQLVDLIMRNLAMYVERGYAPAVAELKKALALSVMPDVIDCFDVSNLGTDIAVGACVRFSAGRPLKSGYRKFRIQGIAGQNDFAMIGELVRRRYSENDIPDLIVIDGGKGQLAAALASLRSISLDVPCIGLAKENEEIYMQCMSDPITLSRSNLGLRMIQHARDEAHRFGLAYNRALRRIITRP